MPWEAIKYVSSGLTLCAFIIAVVSAYLKQQNQEQRKRIEAAPAEDRALLVAKTLEGFHVDTADLSRQQQFEIVMVQIKGRNERYRLLATVVIVLALIGAGLSAYAIAEDKKATEQRAKKSDDVPDTQPSGKDSSTDPNRQIGKRDPTLKTSGGPTPKRTKAGFCNDPRTNQPYQYDIAAFYPQSHVDMSKVFGGDAANPGHLWNVTSEAPGVVLKASCGHGGTHEEITYCGPLRTAQGQFTKTAEIEGWLNGSGGPTTMTVFYQMPCEITDESP